VTKIVYYLYLKILKHIMNFMRQLCFRMTSLYKLSSVSRRNLVCLNYARMFSTSFKLNIKSSTINFDSLDDLKKKPVRFTTSPAYNLDPNRSAMPTVGDDTPWFQGPLVAFSLACFLIYFTMLREENDVDEQLSGRLYDRVDGLEKASILNKINYNKQYDIDSTDLYKRLKEIEEEEAALKAK